MPKVMQTVISIAGTIDPSLSKAIDGVTGKLGGLGKGGKLAALSVAATGLTTAVAGGVAAAGKALNSLGQSYAKASNKLQVKTGATKEEMAGLQDAMKGVYADNFGTDMNDVASAIGIVKQQLGNMPTNTLKGITEDALGMRDAFDYDVGESLRAAQTMMNQFGVTGDQAYSLIAQGAQNGLDYSGEMLDSIDEYSVQFQKLGLNAEDMFNVFQSGSDAGAFNLDKIGDAVKEFSIRAVDGSKTTQQGFQALGMNADHLAQKFASGGDGAKQAFYQVIQSLGKMKDPVQQNLAGVNLFGTMWEDLGPKVVTSLDTITSQYHKTDDAMQSINNIQYNDLGSAIEAIKRQAEVGLLPIASAVANSLTQMMPTISSALQSIMPVMQNTIQTCMPFVTQFLQGMGSALTQIMPLIGQLMSGLMPILTQFIGSILPPIISLIQAILPPLIQVVQAILPPIVQVLQTLIPIVTQIIQAILPVVLSLIQQLVPIIQPLLQLLVQIMQQVIMPIIQPLMQLVQALLPPISALISGIVQALSPLLEFLKPIADVLGTIIGFVGKLLSWGAGAINGLFGALSGGGKSNGGGATGKFATGGFTNGFSIAGEDPRYPQEAVLSFNPAYRRKNIGYWSEAGRKLGVLGSSGVSLSGGSSSSVVYDLSGMQFAPKIYAASGTNSSDLMQQLKTLMPEFVDMVQDALAEREEAQYADCRIY